MARKNKDNSSTIADFFDRTAANLRGSGNAVSLLAMASCVVCAIAMLAIGVPRLRNYLNERSFVEAGAVTVRFVDAPAWFDRTRAAEIRALVATAVGDGSALDPTRLVAAREALPVMSDLHPPAPRAAPALGGRRPPCCTPLPISPSASA